MAGRRAAAASRAVAAALAAVLVVTAVLSTGSGTAVAAASRGHANGWLPASELVEVGGVRLRADAAAAYHAMLVAAAADGATLVASGGYRTYQRQVELKKEKPVLAATPGTSMHGWGVAIDFDMRLTDFAWLREHAATFGWVHPPWAQPRGSKPEPWHWEFVGVPEGVPLPTDVDDLPPVAAPPAPPDPPEPGELVAAVRFEPADGPPGEWFDVHAGLDGLADGARHYAGTVLPGELGNFAVAGYHRAHTAPLRGINELTPGDTLRVRDADGDEHRYEVLGGEVLTAEDGWAVGPRPLDDGGDRLMTLSTGTDEGDLLVVWNRLRAD